MSIDENPPLNKRVGLAVTLAIVVMAWYGINNGWFDFAIPSGEVAGDNTNAGSVAE